MMLNKEPLIEWMPFENNEELLTEDERRAMANGNKYILSGVIQRAEAENGNKRVYPKRILEKEIQNYMKLVKERRALGELDHPDCLRPTAEILTKDGWKKFDDISNSEYVYTLNRDNENIELQRINKKIDEEYSGKMYRFQNRNLSTLVTPNHRFYLIDRNGEGSFVQAKEIFKNRSKYNKHYIPKLGNWFHPEEKSFFELEGVSENYLGRRCKKSLRKKYTNSIKIDAHDFAAFMGIYLSEGCTFNSSGYKIQITQNKGGVSDQIENLLERLPFKFGKYITKRDNGNKKINYVINDARLYKFLEPLGKSYEKYIPDNIKNFSASNLQNFIEWFLMGDGRERVSFHDNRPYGSKDVFSTSKKLIDDLHEVLIKSGGSGNIYTRIPKDRMIEGRQIKAENSRPLYFLHLSTTKGIYLDERSMEITEEKYDGRVCCVNVDNEIFYCRDEGKAYWSGNSAVINLKNASHLVTHIEWRGNDVVGKIEVLNTSAGKELKALCDADVKIGISSRGMGSTRQEGTKTLVEDDYQLICFDIVSEPSTDGAFMMQENKILEAQKQEIFTKGYKINRKLNSILS